MRIGKFALIGFVSLLVAACNWGPGDLDETRDQILTAAYKSQTADFGQFRTYAITDSMTFSYNGKKERVKNDTTVKIIAQVVQNMNALGYSQVEANQNPNLLVDLSYLVSTTTTVYPGYWSDWDWWWQDYFYPGYYPWYPYYPYPMPTLVSSYTTGSVIIEIADVMNVAKDSSVPIVWHGLIRSILTRGHTEAQLLSSINEVFSILPPK